MSNTLYYRHSGKAPTAGVLGMFGAGLVAAVAGAFLYVQLIELIPIIYLNFLIVGGYGALVGGAIAMVGKVGKVRSNLLYAVVGAVCACVAVYVQWAYFLGLKVVEFEGGSTMAMFQNFLTDPADSWEVMQIFNAEGLWTIKKSVVKGGFLWAVWLAEAVGIVAAAVKISMLNADEPYSEADNRWMDKEKFATCLTAVADPKAFVATLERGDYTPLFELGASDDPAKFSRVILYTSPGDADAWVSLDSVALVQKKKNKKPEEVTEHTCKLLRMPAQKAKELAVLVRNAVPAPAPVEATQGATV